MFSWIRCGAAFPRGTAYASTCSTFLRRSGPAGRKHLLQLVRRSDFELIVAAVLGVLVGTPALEDRGMSEAIAFHVIVLHLAHALDAQRLPGQIFARAPAALPAGHAARLGLSVRPFAPGMILERVLAEGFELFHEVMAHLHRERGRHADMLQRAVVVIQAEQKRSDGVLAALMPAKSGDHAVGGARVFDLEHRALARLIGGVSGFRHDAVEPGPFEAVEPVDSEL